MSPTVPHQLVLYSKPGCHLCEGLQEKLEAIQQSEPCPLDFKLDIRDITTRIDWFDAYQYEIPVLYWISSDGMPIEDLVTKPLNTEMPGQRSDLQQAKLVPIPRPSPRASIQNVLKILRSSLP